MKRSLQGNHAPSKRGRFSYTRHIDDSAHHSQRVDRGHRSRDISPPPRRWYNIPRGESTYSPGYLCELVKEKLSSDIPVAGIHTHMNVDRGYLPETIPSPDATADDLEECHAMRYRVPLANTIYPDFDEMNVEDMYPFCTMKTPSLNLLVYYLEQNDLSGGRIWVRRSDLPRNYWFHVNIILERYVLLNGLVNQGLWDKGYDLFWKELNSIFAHRFSSFLKLFQGNFENRGPTKRKEWILRLLNLINYNAMKSFLPQDFTEERFAELEGYIHCPLKLDELLTERDMLEYAMKTIAYMTSEKLKGYMDRPIAERVYNFLRNVVDYVDRFDPSPPHIAPYMSHCFTCDMSLSVEHVSWENVTKCLQDHRCFVQCQLCGGKAYLLKCNKVYKEHVYYKVVGKIPGSESRYQETPCRFRLDKDLKTSLISCRKLRCPYEKRRR